ncbi:MULTISPECIES: F0F1 ATP synthase subunit delta [unclassified Campylobacter]|uniref:F0F1 ATP synthase subunit delta n=1 Tax=unclassified Campylobacter TaxID=2593542 RepID=UPI0014521806|nr:MULTISPECIES: F0F1 ATP synthase subunit delta [unclassified Campylobacter]QCD53219.1 ATP synthase, F1 complex, delta subunit [Campylobacter sp. RM16192]
MKELIAKKYVKALMADLNRDDLEKFISDLDVVVSAFNINKFRNIITSPSVKNDKKIDLVLSFLSSNNSKIINFIKLLGENKRLDILPDILNELAVQKAQMDNIFRGTIYGNFEIDQSQITELEKSFSKRFNAKIMLEAVKSDYNGIKIELDDLGVEASLSIDRLKSQMTEYILKAI